MTTPSSGYVSLSVHPSPAVPRTKTLSTPADHVIMISFRQVQPYRELCTLHGLTVAVGDRRGRRWNACDRYGDRDSRLVETNTITLQWPGVSNVGSCSGPDCFRVLFSFHPKSKATYRLSSGLYNCSGEGYRRLQPHLTCNMDVECEDGRDEAGHCLFSSPACGGWVALHNKCYRYVSKKTIDNFSPGDQYAPVKAAKFCSSLNASVVAPTTRQDIKDLFKRYVLDGQVVFVHYLYGHVSVPSIYRRILVTSDKYVTHNKLLADFEYKGRELCFFYHFYHIRAHSCTDLKDYPFMERRSKYYTLCEFTVDGREDPNTEAIPLAMVAFPYREVNVSVATCPSGEIVHAFLACSPHDACGQRLPHLCALENSMGSLQGSHHRMTSVPVFTCSDGVTTLPFTLVCDFRRHCSDQSDETFCQHPVCDAFVCSSGQCVPLSQRCDMVSDCSDDSDESHCLDYAYREECTFVIDSPVLFDFDRAKSFFIVKKMDAHTACPNTHYRCPGDYNDCFPVYTRCNGWYDCLGREDEEGCEDMSCPGFYRCVHSTVCVDGGQLCDGWPHCPQWDDELVCDLTCPPQCLCQGHAFLCPQPFSAHLFPQLRYLDGQGSGMTPSDVSHNHYLVSLSLSGCGLRVVSALTNSNLQDLDLSNNEIAVVNMSVWTGLLNLRSLVLASNPLHQLIPPSGSSQPLDGVRSVDLSYTALTVFDSKALSGFFKLRSLNLSFSAIHTLHVNGFTYTSKVTRLYLSGNPIQTFPAYLLKPLTNLDVLVAPTYKLCCIQLLPDHWQLIDCRAPTDEISSCQDLLQSGTYRIFLWFISLLSVLGNVWCLAMRLFTENTVSAIGFHVFVAHLSIADLLMGVYIAIIGVADSLFHGSYLFQEGQWRHSVACKVAGFLSLLSCEVSALIIWLITLDRFIVLHFPFSSVRFQRTSAAVACLITWLAGLSLAVTPLLPVTVHWEFFSQTGICIPLPVTRQLFKGKAFSIGVFIVFNFILFLLIATGQAFIYWSVQKNAMNTYSTRVSRDLTIARRLISVAVSNFLCWFPIGLCGLLALADISIPGEANVALAIFVLPLNSALNPFLYTFNVLREKRRKAKEAMLLQWLEKHSDLLGSTGHDWA